MRNVGVLCKTWSGCISYAERVAAEHNGRFEPALGRVVCGDGTTYFLYTNVRDAMATDFCSVDVQDGVSKDDADLLKTRLRQRPCS